MLFRSSLAPLLSDGRSSTFKFLGFVFPSGGLPEGAFVSDLETAGALLEARLVGSSSEDKRISPEEVVESCLGWELVFPAVEAEVAEGAESGELASFGFGTTFLADFAFAASETPETDSSTAAEKSASLAGIRKEPWHFGHFPRLPAWKSLTCKG